MSAAIKAGITFFYFGAHSEKSMNPLTIFDVAKKSSYKLHIEAGILKEECIKQTNRSRQLEIKINQV
jgi:tRNA(Arg) A34 adenosine deaminase TadA